MRFRDLIEDKIVETKMSDKDNTLAKKIINIEKNPVRNPAYGQEIKRAEKALINKYGKGWRKLVESNSNESEIKYQDLSIDLSEDLPFSSVARKIYTKLLKKNTDYKKLLKEIEEEFDNSNISISEYDELIRAVKVKFNINESEIKYQALSIAKEVHSALADLTFLEMMSVMDPANPAKKDVQELEKELNDLTNKVGEFIQKYIPDVIDADAGDVSEEPEEDKNEI